MLLEFRCHLSYKHSWRPLTSHYCRCWCRLMSSSLLQFITPLRLHTSYNMITCWVKLTKSISEECVGAEISAAVVGTPTVPPNYTCLLVGAGLMPAMKPGCITWITTNWITNWHCRVTLFIQCEHTKGFWPDCTGIMTWYVVSCQIDRMQSTKNTYITAQNVSIFSSLLSTNNTTADYFILFGDVFSN